MPAGAIQSRQETSMDFGIFIPPVATSWKTAKRAEQLGFARVWFYDTHMLNAELFTSMAAAAMHTSKIRLGTGVLVPGGRIAPVAASGLASLNALAPGRIDFGVGTGFTARRTMGLPPLKLDDLEEYIRVVMGLLRGETVEWSFEDLERKIRFLDPAIGAINLDDPIPLHLSAFGPRGRKLAAKLNAGWIVTSGQADVAGARLGTMQAEWTAAGRPADELFATCMVIGMPLRDGEGFNSARVKAQVGPFMTAALHAQAEMEAEGGSGYAGERPDSILERYRAIYRSYEPDDARYLQNHRGHLMYLRPDEEDLCTPEMIRDHSFTATKADLRERLRRLKDCGYKHVGIAMSLSCTENLLEDWADVIEGV
jgi:5,10-methylenetetrahydromethanopterin reductase